MKMSFRSAPEILQFVDQIFVENKLIQQMFDAIRLSEKIMDKLIFGPRSIAPRLSPIKSLGIPALLMPLGNLMRENN